MSELEHAPLAPSSAPIWGNCSGSVLAQTGIPNPDTEKTREGTAAHGVAANVLTCYKIGLHPATGDAYLGKQASNGVIIDETIIEGAQVMVDDVVAVCDRHGCAADLLVEHRVRMPKIHDQNWGTLDAAVYIPERKLIFIWDYKHGNRDCPPKDNLQLIDYLQGLVEYYEIDGALDQQITVVARIVQPFCYYARGPVKEWVVQLSDLRAHWNILQAKAHEAFTNPKLTTGLWCRDCRAVGKCAATRKARYNFIELVNEPYEMDSMQGADLAVERDILSDGIDVAKKRLEAVEDELRHRIRNGEKDSGYTVEAVQGREKWAIPPSQASALFSQFDVDISKDDVLTPSQSLKKTPADKRPLVASIIKRFTTRSSALKLVPVDESRTARAFKPKTEQ